MGTFDQGHIPCWWPFVQRLFFTQTHAGKCSVFSMPKSWCRSKWLWWTYRRHIGRQHPCRHIFHALSFSVFGYNISEQGRITRFHSVVAEDENLCFHKVNVYMDVLAFLIENRFYNACADVYALVLMDEVRDSEDLARHIDNVPAMDYVTNTVFWMQFHYVLRLIMTWANRGAERDMFWCNRTNGVNTTIGLLVFQKLSTRYLKRLTISTELKADVFFEQVTFMTDSDLDTRLLAMGRAMTMHMLAKPLLSAEASMVGTYLTGTLPRLWCILMISRISKTLVADVSFQGTHGKAGWCLSPMYSRSSPCASAIGIRCQFSGRQD